MVRRGVAASHVRATLNTITELHTTLQVGGVLQGCATGLHHCVTHGAAGLCVGRWCAAGLCACRLGCIEGHLCNMCSEIAPLTHWGRVTHICVGKLTTIVSDNGLSPGRCQAITWTNDGILLIGPLGTNFSEILIEIYTFSFKKIHLKMSSGKCWSSYLGLSVLNHHHISQHWQHFGELSGCSWHGSYLVLGHLQLPVSVWHKIFPSGQ